MNSPLRRTVFTFVVFCSFFSWQQPVRGQETEKTEAGVPSLKIGDPAPQLRVDHWLTGEAVESYSRDHVYVVEFWATWCAPCIKAMPHLSELAEQYSKDGLVVIAMTKQDEGNTREAVEKFIKEKGEKFRFRFALCEGTETHRNFMEAAGQQGIPCSFVIDREGNVAYIGHPHDLDYVLERVLKGQWRGKADADELREMNNSIATLAQMAQTDPDKALQITEHIRRVNPQRTKSIDFAYVEVMIFCRKKMFDEAKAIIVSLSENADKPVDWGTVAMVSGLLASTELNPEGTHRDYAAARITAAEDALKDDWQNLLQVALAYQISGNKENYKACMNRVIELCPDEQVKKALQLAMSLQSQLPPE